MTEPAAALKSLWPPLLIWGLIIIAASYFAPQLGTKLQSGNMLAPNTESDSVRQIIEKELRGEDSNSLLVVMSSEQLPLSDPGFAHATAALTTQLSPLAGVSSINSYWDSSDQRFVGKDGKTTFLVIHLSASSEEVQKRLVPQITQLLQLPPPGFKVRLTGIQAINHDLYYESIAAVNSSDFVAVPIILLVLLVIFRSLIASLIPLGLGLISIVVSLGLYYFYACYFHGDAMAPAIISMLGLGVGIDYSLFLVTRFREELALGLNPHQAALRTSATAGKAVVFSGVTLISSVASLLIVDNPLFRSLAVAMAVIVLVSMLAATTLLPAVLALLGPKVNSWRILLPKLTTPQTGQTFWRRWAQAVMKRPVIFSLLSLAPILLIAYPARNLQTGWPNVKLLSAESPARQGYEQMVQQFGEGELQSIDVIMKVKQGTVAGEKNLSEIYRMVQNIKQDPAVMSVLSFVSLKEDLDLEDYKDWYIHAPVRLVTLPTQLGVIGTGLRKSVTGLQEIQQGMQAMSAGLQVSSGRSSSDLATVGQQFTKSATALEQLSRQLTESNFDRRGAAAKKAAEGSRLLTVAAAEVNTMIGPSSSKGPAAMLAGLEKMRAALDQIIPGLDSVAEQLSQAGKQSTPANLSEAAERGDFGLRIAASGAGKPAQAMLNMLVNLNGAVDIARLRVVPRQGADSENTKALISRLRALNGEFSEEFGTISVGGSSATMIDYDDQIRWALPRVVGLVMLITFLVMLVLLKSILLPIKAIIMNTLSVLAAYGILVLVFQHGYFANLLGFTPLGYVGSPTIVMLFAVLFGLSMDYEVFLLSRIKEAHDRTGNNEESVALGLEQTAGIITGAASIMLVVFAAFLINGVITIKEFGVGLFTAVLLDATLIRIILVPAFMRLLGEWNWWAPKWLLNLLNRVNVDQ